MPHLQRPRVPDHNPAASLPRTWAGRRDPTWTRTDRSWTAATWTPDGAGTVHMSWDDAVIHAEAWGEGADWLLARVDQLLGLHDPVHTFDPGPALAALHEKHPSEHRGAGLPLAPVMAQVVCGQRVTTIEATESWLRLCRLRELEAPGPHPLLLPPEPRWLARVPDAPLRSCGLDVHRAATLREISFRRRRLQAALELPAEEAVAFLQRLPGVGPWTATATVAACTGDADIVVLGDLHVPRNVVYALTGELRGTDERMLELLEPWRGHRARVTSLVQRAGQKHPRSQAKPELFRGWSS